MRSQHVSFMVSNIPQFAVLGAKMMNVSLKYLRRIEAATFVREKWAMPCSPKWLAKLAVVGGGPIYRKAGRYPIYLQSDLDAWAQSRIAGGITMGARHPNPRLVKSHRSYKIEEIALLFSIHKNTVGTWLKEGLATSDRHRPFLICGDVLIEFLKVRRSKAKRPTSVGTIYCLPCRGPQKPAGAMIEYVGDDRSGQVSGICPACERMMYRAINSAKISAFFPNTMSKHNAQNERIKREYLEYQGQARGLSETTLDAIAAALTRFEVYTKFKDFKAFRREQAMGFKAQLLEKTNARTREKLSKATLRSILKTLKAFFDWLVGRPGYKAKLTYGDAEYFNLTEKDNAIAIAIKEPKFPTLEQVRHVLAKMPDATDIEKRNRAMVAFTVLTIARVEAIATLKVKHVDLSQGRVMQTARDMKTKFSKTFDTYFYPVGDEIVQIVVDWIDYLQAKLLWSATDPLFPATMMINGKDNKLQAAGLKRENWKSTSPIRAIFKAAFENAGLPSFNPHSFRKTINQLGTQVCKTPEEFKAWSQNCGHNDVLTTFMSYGQVSTQRQAELMKNLGKAKNTEAKPEEFALRLARLEMQIGLNN
eukprot:gene2443-2481_t